MTDLSELLDRLRGRLDEDEQVALDAGGRDASRRHWMRDAISCVVDGDGRLVVYGEGTPTSGQADHIARHDPDRVLREVAAKRAMLDVIEATLRPVPTPPGYPAAARTLKLEVEKAEEALATLFVKILSSPLVDPPERQP